MEQNHSDAPAGKPTPEEIPVYALGPHEQEHMSLPTPIYVPVRVLIEAEEILRRNHTLSRPAGAELPTLEDIAHRPSNGIAELAETPDGFHVIATRTPVGVIYIRSTFVKPPSSGWNEEMTSMCFVPSGISIPDVISTPERDPRSWDERTRLAVEYVVRLATEIQRMVNHKDDNLTEEPAVDPNEKYDGSKPNQIDIERYGLTEYEREHCSAPIEMYRSVPEFNYALELIRAGRSVDPCPLEHVRPLTSTGKEVELAVLPDGTEVLASWTPYGVIYLRASKFPIGLHRKKILLFLPAGVPVRDDLLEDDRKQTLLVCAEHLAHSIFRLVWEEEQVNRHRRDLQEHSMAMVHLPDPLIYAANELVRSLHSQADCRTGITQQPLWGSWALRTAFSAGVDWRESQTTPLRTAEEIVETSRKVTETGRVALKDHLKAMGGTIGLSDEEGVRLFDVLLTTSLQASHMKQALPPVTVQLDPVSPPDIQNALAIVDYELTERGSRMFFLDGASAGDLARSFERLSNKAVVEFNTHGIETMGANPLALYWKKPSLVEPNTGIPYFGIGLRLPRGWIYLRNLLPGEGSTELLPYEYPVVLVLAEGIAVEVGKKFATIMLQFHTLTD